MTKRWAGRKRKKKEKMLKHVRKCLGLMIFNLFRKCFVVQKYIFK